MTPFQKSEIPESEMERAVADIVRQWNNHDPAIRKCFKDYTSATQVEFAARRWVKEEAGGEVFLNDTYQVMKRERGGWVHLSVKRLDRGTCHDWRHMQQIKNELVGPENEGIELYPAESRLVDGANQYHIWVLKDPTIRLPVGFDSGRVVTDSSIAGSVNRKVGVM
jgi:hypothetical protein